MSTEDVEIKAAGRSIAGGGAFNDVGIQTNEKVYKQELFTLESWRFGEYAKAIECDLTTSKVIRSLNQAISLVPDFGSWYFKCYSDDHLSAAVNHLLALYDGGDDIFMDIHLVSNCAMWRLAFKMGSHLLHLYLCVPVIPDDALLEDWVFAQLRHTDLHWFTMVASVCQNGLWKQSDAIFFDPDKLIQVYLGRPRYLAPIKWNQGGYDAMFVDNEDGLVRFAQVVRAEDHTFEDRYFVDILNKLVAGGLKKIVKVELCYVVHAKGLGTFLTPVSEKEFKTHVMQVVK